MCKIIMLDMPALIPTEDKDVNSKHGANVKAVPMTKTKLQKQQSCYHVLFVSNSNSSNTEEPWFTATSLVRSPLR